VCGTCRIPAWKLEKYSSTHFRRHYGSRLLDPNEHGSHPKHPGP
jgi:hypothetical protein